jgi:hypothetical protein
LRPIPHRKKLAVATALTAGAIALIAIPNSADASHAGGGSTLTSSNGTGTIKFSTGKNATTADLVTGASWSPDGSRAAYVAADGAIHTMRYNESASVDNANGWDHLWWIVDSDGNARAHPTWSSDGGSVYWSEEQGANGTWRLFGAASGAYYGDGTGLTPISPDDNMDYTNPDGGPSGIVLLQRQADNGAGTPTGSADVVEFNPATFGDDPTLSVVLNDASSPAMSPDGSRIAFVRSDGTNNQIWTSDSTGGGAVKLTTDAVDHDHPTWSPNGSTIAFNTNGESAIATAVVSSGTVTSVSTLSGLPAYAPTASDKVVRLQGSNRFGTADAISQSHWKTAGAASDSREQALSVTLSRSDTYADAVTGSALAAAKQGPLLMTPPTSLNPDTKAEISRVLGADNKSATVYILGGTGAISQATQNLLAAHYSVVRLSGLDRYATSIAIADSITDNPTYVLAATGQDFADALGAGAAAGSFDVPGRGTPGAAVVVLTNNKILPPATKVYLDKWQAKNVGNDEAALFGIGGQAFAATQKAPYNSIEEVGSNRYETALFLAEVFFGNEQAAGVTTGTGWPDALAGGALLATINAPLLLTDTSKVLNVDADWRFDSAAGSIATAYIFGGNVATANDAQIGADISGPGLFTKGTNPTSVSSSAVNQASARSAGTSRTPAQIKAAVKAQVARR